MQLEEESGKQSERKLKGTRYARAFLQYFSAIKILILKYNCNFYNYILMIESICIIPSKMTYLRGNPNQQYYHLGATEWKCKHVILGTHKQSKCLVSVAKSDWKWQRVPLEQTTLTILDNC